MVSIVARIASGLIFRSKMQPTLASIEDEESRITITTEHLLHCTMVQLTFGWIGGCRKTAIED
jgi:hypothetical protein